MSHPGRAIFVVLLLVAELGCARKEAPATNVDDGQIGDPSSAAAAEPAAETPEAARGPRKPDVEYVPTPQPIVENMLVVAKIKKTDLLYDLGCGDGRIVVTAAKKYGVKAVGYDIDPKRVAEARENVKQNGVENLVTIEQADIFTLDLSRANVVTLYLLPELNVKLIPQLDKLASGSRIVSHDFDMEGVEPDKKLKLEPAGVPERHTVYLFTVPLKKLKK
jgi:SAM-dependent methyltransferase